MRYAFFILLFISCKQESVNSFDVSKENNSLTVYGKNEKIKINGGTLEFISNPIKDKVTGGYYIAKIHPMQPHPDAVTFNFCMSSTPNPGSTQNDEVFTFGWNINPGGGPEKLGKAGIGWSIENHYEPSTGHVLSELHEFFISKEGKQYRPGSFTLNQNDFSSWEHYNTVGRQYYKNPVDTNPYMFLANNSDTGSSIKLLGSKTQTGVQLYADASATNFQISPLGYEGEKKYLYMNTWNSVALPSFNSYRMNGKSYNNISETPVFENDTQASSLPKGTIYTTSQGVMMRKK